MTPEDKLYTILKYDFRPFDNLPDAQVTVRRLPPAFFSEFGTYNYSLGANQYVTFAKYDLNNQVVRKELNFKELYNSILEDLLVYEFRR